MWLGASIWSLGILEHSPTDIMSKFSQENHKQHKLLKIKGESSYLT